MAFFGHLCLVKRGRNRTGKSFFGVSWHIKPRLCRKRTLSGRRVKCLSSSLPMISACSGWRGNSFFGESQHSHARYVSLLAHPFSFASFSFRRSIGISGFFDSLQVYFRIPFPAFSKRLPRPFSRFPEISAWFHAQADVYSTLNFHFFKGKPYHKNRHYFFLEKPFYRRFRQEVLLFLEPRQNSTASEMRPCSMKPHSDEST